jgi:hypothetical protein
MNEIIFLASPSNIRLGLKSDDFLNFRQAPSSVAPAVEIDFKANLRKVSKTVSDDPDKSKASSVHQVSMASNFFFLFTTED